MVLFAVRYVVPTGEAKVVLCKGLMDVMKEVSSEGDKVTKTLFVRMVAPVNVPTDLSSFRIDKVEVQDIEIPANLLFEVQRLECEEAREPVATGDQPDGSAEQSH